MWGKNGLKEEASIIRKKISTFLEILNRHILIMESKKSWCKLGVLACPHKLST